MLEEKYRHFPFQPGRNLITLHYLLLKCASSRLEEVSREGGWCNFANLRKSIISFTYRAKVVIREVLPFLCSYLH